MQSRKEKQSPGLVALGGAIRAARTQAGMSQTALADAAGLDRAYVGRVERGEVNISFLNIELLAGRLKMRPSWLLDRAGL